MRLVLTGEVGAGKSTALAAFADLGWFTLSADQLVTELWENPRIQERAAALWGADLFDGGTLNRPLLAQRALTCPAEREKLNGLLHPAVRRLTEERLGERREAVVEIPLLFEAGRPWWCEGVLFLWASPELRRQRNAFRMDESQMTHREAGFLPTEERAARSDWSFCNDGSREDLILFVKQVSDQARRMSELKLALYPDGTRACLPLALAGQALEQGAVLLSDFYLSARWRQEALKRDERC